MERVAIGVALSLLVGTVPPHAVPSRAVRVSSTPELLAALRKAVPGGVIELEPGDYAGGRVEGVAGSAKSPIVVRPAEATAPPRFTGGLQLSDCCWITLEALRFEGFAGNGLNVDDGGTFESPAIGIVLRHLELRDVGARGNDDAIKLSGVQRFVVADCTVERWGRGGSAIDCVGCADGVIEESIFRDRAQDGAANGVQLKGGTRDVVVRRCRFEEAGERAINLGGSTGRPFFRPSPQGFEAKAVTVEGCTFLGSLAPIAFVGVDGALVRFNTIVHPRKWVARILQETQEPDFVPCRGGRFTDNLVVWRSSEVQVAVNVGPKTEPASFEFARNFWWCEDAPARSRPELPVAEKDRAGGDDPRFLDPAAGDFGVARGSPARGQGAHAFTPRR